MIFNSKHSKDEHIEDTVFLVQLNYSVGHCNGRNTCPYPFVKTHRIYKNKSES